MIRLVLVAVMSLLALTQAIAAPAIGQKAPAFSAIDSNGKLRSLSEFKGRIVVLEWTNNGCPYVRKHYGSGNMQKVQADLTAQGAVWLSIISSAPGKQGFVNGAEANQLTAARSAHPTAVLLDPTGEVGHAYEAQTTPHMFIIDRQGILRYMGAIDDQPTTDPSSLQSARTYVREAFAAVSAGRPVEVTATDPYGCSVKYQ
ncbi:MAG: thioredoxin family protein [Micropepsaceae bacterium]